MSLLKKIDVELHNCKQILKTYKKTYSKLDYDSISHGIPRLRRHLLQGWREYKGMTSQQVKAKLVKDSKQYYGDVLASFIGEHLPSIVGEEGEVAHALWDIKP